MGVKAIFNKDGTFSIMGIPGQYQIKDADTIRLCAMGTIEDDKFELDGDTLILTKLGGAMTQWIRVNDN